MGTTGLSNIKIQQAKSKVEEPVDSEVIFKYLSAQLVPIFFFAAIRNCGSVLEA
jgi:hypothetical protein